MLPESEMKQRLLVLALLAVAGIGVPYHQAGLVCEPLQVFARAANY
jgi:hypothetical protein